MRIYTWMLGGLFLLIAACGSDSLVDDGFRLLKEEKPYEALEKFEAAIEKDESNMRAWLGKGRALALDSLGGMHDAAIICYEKVIAGTGTEDTLHLEAIFRRGLSRYAEADFENALPDLNTAIDGGIQTAEAYTFRALIRQGQEPIEALKDYELALKADPDYVFALTGRGYLASLLGDNKRAIADLSRALEINPEDKNAYLNRGYTYLQAGDATNAEADFDKAIAIDSLYGPALTYAGIVRTNTGRNLEAVPFFQRAIRVQPNDAALHYYYGICLYNLGQTEAGCESLRTGAAAGHIEAANAVQQYCGG